MRFDPHLLKEKKQLISRYYHGLKTLSKNKKKKRKTLNCPSSLKKNGKKKTRLPLFSKKNIELLLLKTQSDTVLYST